MWQVAVVCISALSLFVILKSLARRQHGKSKDIAEDVLTFIDSPLGKATVLGVAATLVIGHLGIIQSVNEGNLERTRTAIEDSLTQTLSAINEVNDSALALTLVDFGDVRTLKTAQERLFAANGPLLDSYLTTYLNVCNLEWNDIDAILHGSFLLYDVSAAGSWHMLSAESEEEFSEVKDLIDSTRDQVKWLVSTHVKIAMQHAINALLSTPKRLQRDPYGGSCDDISHDEFSLAIDYLVDFRRIVIDSLEENTYSMPVLGDGENADAVRTSLKKWRKDMRSDPTRPITENPHTESVRLAWSSLSVAELHAVRRIGFSLDEIRELASMLEQHVLLESRRQLMIWLSEEMDAAE